ncbi:hypothetical protein K0A97_00710 [Patescibacteria group bacterium]|nr:hypothetical protein [Patescibacteria group bacterium]
MNINLFKNVFDILKNSNLRNLEEIVIKGESFLCEPNLNPSYIIAPSFDQGIGRESYNHVLADTVIVARNFYEAFNQKKELEIITQLELGTILRTRREKDVCTINGHYTRIKSLKKMSNSCLKEFMREVEGKLYFDYCQKEPFFDYIEKDYLNGTDILIITHPRHLKRVLDIAKKSGINGKPFIRKER